jgi:hypothetical protein
LNVIRHAPETLIENVPFSRPPAAKFVQPITREPHVLRACGGIQAVEARFKFICVGGVNAFFRTVVKKLPQAFMLETPDHGVIPLSPKRLHHYMFGVSEGQHRIWP